MKVIASILGSLLGAIAISLLSFLTHLLFFPQVFNDGLYPLVYLLIVPQGVWLGGVMGYALTRNHTGNHRWVGMTLLVGSVVFVGAALILALSQSSNSWDYLIGYFGVALIWASALFLWAIFLLATAEPAAL
jgi:hypothetical protein